MLIHLIPAQVPQLHPLSNFRGILSLQRLIQNLNWKCSQTPEGILCDLVESCCQWFRIKFIQVPYLPSFASWEAEIPTFSDLVDLCVQPTLLEPCQIRAPETFEFYPWTFRPFCILPYSASNAISSGQQIGAFDGFRFHPTKTCCMTAKALAVKPQLSLCQPYV